MRPCGVRQTLKRLRYKPYTRFVLMSPNQYMPYYRFEMRCRVLDSQRLRTTRLYCSLPCRSEQIARMTVACVKDVASLLAKTAEEHEAYEWLRFDGVQVTCPHPRGPNSTGPPYIYEADVEKILTKHGR